jgi:hypothetical protein
VRELPGPHPRLVQNLPAPHFLVSPLLPIHHVRETLPRPGSSYTLGAQYIHTIPRFHSTSTSPLVHTVPMICASHVLHPVICTHFAHSASYFHFCTCRRDRRDAPAHAGPGMCRLSRFRELYTDPPGLNIANPAGPKCRESSAQKKNKKKRK